MTTRCTSTCSRSTSIYIVEKRFNLELVHRGHPSRTGKMLPPKLGLMSYVADAYLDGRSDTFCCKGFRSASTSCTRSPSTPPTRAAPRRRPRVSAGCTTSSRRRASATTARSTSVSPKPSRCGSTSDHRTVHRLRRTPRLKTPNGLRCRRCRSKSPGGYCRPHRSRRRGWCRRCCSPHVDRR